MELKVIAGRGGPHSQNWGAAVVKDKETIETEIRALEPYYGKTVYLGGGGFRDGTFEPWIDSWKIMVEA